MWYLETKKMSYDDIEVSLDMSHMQGVYGDLAIHTFKMDTLQLDTIYFDIRQDTSKIVFDGGVINGPKNPRVEFKANIEAQLSNDDAQVMLKFLDAQDKTGILFGINAKPLREGQGKGDGTVFRIIPENPIIAYHQFSFVDNENWVYLHKNMRVYANVNMYDPRGMGIRVQSLATDTVSLQNIDVELRNIQLAEICSVLPFMPNITGLFTAGAHYIQTEKSLQLSSDVTIDSLTYEKQLVGDLGIGATWFPGEDGIQHLTTYIAHNDKDVFAAAGALYPTSHKKDSVIINSNLNHFPTSIANVFIPTELASLSGDIDGDIRIRGYLDSPIVKGNIVMDSVSVNSAQYGAKFTLGKTPLVIKDSRLFFNKYSIYTTSTNPFTIDGYIDFRDLNNPLANLTMKASDYELLNAKRSKESLVYGKAYIGMNATIRGPLSMLQMRGKVSLLGNTDVTYIYTDSPLAVQDRLSGLVTFTSFSDTLSTTNDKIPTVSFGGLDLVLGIEIAPSVVFNIDLTEDESNGIQVQGGRNL